MIVVLPDLSFDLHVWSLTVLNVLASFILDDCQGTTGTTATAVVDPYAMVPGTRCLNWWGILALCCRLCFDKNQQSPSWGRAFLAFTCTLHSIVSIVALGDGCRSITNEDACKSSRDGSDRAMSWPAFYFTYFFHSATCLLVYCC